jgi:hypothetical protein
MFIVVARCYQFRFATVGGYDPNMRKVIICKKSTAVSSFAFIQKPVDLHYFFLFVTGIRKRCGAHIRYVPAIR